jgi:hypothetical protein
MNAKEMILTDRERKYYRWAYAALVELAKVELALRNTQVEGGEWPAGQEWEDMAGSSRAIFMIRVRDRLDIDEQQFLQPIRDDLVDVDDLWDGGGAIGAHLGCPDPSVVAAKNQRPTLADRVEQLEEWMRDTQAWIRTLPSDGVGVAGRLKELEKLAGRSCDHQRWTGFSGSKTTP